MEQTDYHSYSHIYGLPCIVSSNKFTDDTEAEIQLVKNKCEDLNVSVVLAEHWSQGGAGAEELAKEVVRLADSNSDTVKFTYSDDASLDDKLIAVAPPTKGKRQLLKQKYPQNGPLVIR